MLLPAPPISLPTPLFIKYLHWFARELGGINNRDLFSHILKSNVSAELVPRRSVMEGSILGLSPWLSSPYDPSQGILRLFISLYPNFPVFIRLLVILY